MRGTIGFHCLSIPFFSFLFVFLFWKVFKRSWNYNRIIRSTWFCLEQDGINSGCCKRYKLGFFSHCSWLRFLKIELDIFRQNVLPENVRYISKNNSYCVPGCEVLAKGKRFPVLFDNCLIHIINVILFNHQSYFLGFMTLHHFTVQLCISLELDSWTD